MRYSKGVMWLDDCRIPFVDEGENKLVFDRSGKGGYRKELVGCEIKEEYKWEQQQGRFTPNLLVCDDMLNDGVISKTLKSNGANRTKEQTIYGGGKGFPTWNGGHNGDSGSSSRYYDLDLWFDKMIERL